jgi:hypothetical protein
VPATATVRPALYCRSSAGVVTSGCGVGKNIITNAAVTISAKTRSSQLSSIQCDATAPAREPTAIATPPVTASRTLMARCRPCANTPEADATKTCTIVIAATDLTSRRPAPSSGGTYSSSGIMTMAPPTPMRPDTKAPTTPRTNSRPPKRSDTRRAAYLPRLE